MGKVAGYRAENTSSAKWNPSRILRLAREGKKDLALQLIEAHLQQFPDDESAMLLFAGLTDDYPSAIGALEKVIARNPKNVAARKGLKDLRGKLLTSGSGLGKEIVRYAGGIRWGIKGDNRSVGTLFAAGALTKKDLAWAGQKAYNASTAWAAAIFLRHDEIRQLTMTLEQAGAVIWPFDGLNAPLLSLIRRKEITLKTLAFTIVRGPTLELRQACAVMGYVLITNWLQLKDVQAELTSRNYEVSHLSDTPSGALKESDSQPPASQESGKGRMRIVQGSAYLREQELQVLKRNRRLKVVGRLLLLIVMAGAFVGAWLSATYQWPVWRWFVPEMVLLGFVWQVVLPLFEQSAQDYDNYFAGRRGEDLMAEKLSDMLDDRWTLYRNIDLPDRNGDIDAVLVGPQGVYALEVKAYKGKYRLRGERWQYYRYGTWHPVTLGRNPSRQAKRNAARLGEFLADAGIKIWVHPRVVWAGEQPVFIAEPSVPVWQLNDLEWAMADLSRQKSIPLEKYQKVENALSLYAKGYQQGKGAN